ncbi:ATO2 Ammonia transport outward protein 2 [Candida maltosa Xu316]|uniref:Ammonia transport protein, putative n=1 Tax=Candida maltosa (strain Xu316) TaxID=1245528 RepID=M3K7T2_CANMX|nr:Ammonia transport protein, putative [Candida maltosa Xu316]
MSSTSLNSKDQSIRSEHNEKVQAVGQDGDYIILGNNKYLKEDIAKVLATAYTGWRPANAAALGLVSFGITAFVLTLYLAGAKDITAPNAAVGAAVFYGGLVEILVGAWCFFLGDTLFFTVFISLGAFWLSFAAIYLPAFGIIEAYALNDPTQLGSAIGFYMIAWGLVCTVVALATMKLNLMLFLFFVFLVLLFYLLAAAYFTGSSKCVTAGASFGFIASIISLYMGLSLAISKQNCYVSLPLVEFPKPKFTLI